MNILGIGPAELLLVFIIVLIVLGPDRLPELAKLARTLGKAMRKLMQMSMEFREAFAEELRDMEAISNEVKETAEAMKQVADIGGMLMESAEPVPPSTSPSTGSGHRTVGEPEEEPESTDVQQTTTQVEAERKATSGKDSGESSKGERE